MMDLKTLSYYEAQMETFLDGLHLIQQRHHSWFKSRRGEYESQAHDNIGNHIAINCQYPKLIFGYWTDSELPENIREECNAFFDVVFNMEFPFD